MSATTYQSLATMEGVAELPDAELLAKAYELVWGCSDTDTKDALYFVFQEIGERWAPAAEWENTLRLYRESHHDARQRRAEIESVAESMARGARIRLAALTGHPGLLDAS